MSVQTVAGERGELEVPVSTAELRRRLGEQGLCVVDLRPLPEYNGWRAGTAERGGHVPGAVSLPVGWLSRLDDAELLALLESKGIVSSDEVVVYGDPEAVSLFRSRAAEHTSTPVRTYAAGERIATEHSYKYAPREFDALLHRARFEETRCWQDGDGAFAVFYAR